MNKQIEWLKDKKDFLSINKIEKELKIPDNTLKHWLAERRELPDKWVNVLSEWIKQFRK